jgi:hypothetical protein
MDGSDVPAEAEIVAVVEGGGGSYTTTVDGQYGNPPFDYLTVSGYIERGAIIEFFVDGVKANETFPFKSGTITELDLTVTIVDTTPPSVTINQASGQADPTNASPINFTVVFSESVSDFATGDVTLSGTAGATTATVTGSGTTYNVAVSGMASNGTVIATIAAGVAHDAAGNPNTASTSTDNSVTYDTAGPTVTINQAAGQADPTNTSPINFTVVFSESVSDFATGDVTLGGTAGATTATVTGSGTTYNVAVSGMTSDGTVTASIAAGVAHDAAGNGNTASTSTDNSVTYDTGILTVTINQAAGQADPTSASPINFTVVFSASVSDFATGDVTLSGTAGATTATVTGSGTTYNVAVSGMTTSGTVIASIAAGVAHDATSHANTASTSADNSVTYTPAVPVSFTVTLPASWNLLSTPILLDADSDSLGQIFDATSQANIEICLSWDAVSKRWVQVLADYELLPLYAIYVKVEADAMAVAEFIPSEELSGLPARDLVPGANLIGPAPALAGGVFPAMPLNLALISIAEAGGGLRGYTMVISPEHNQPGWAYALGGEIKDLLPYKGYWVVMENADTLYGFSTTPIP